MARNPSTCRYGQQSDLDGKATFLKHLINLHEGEVRESTESKRVKVHVPLPVDAKGHKPYRMIWVRVTRMYLYV